MDVSRILKQVDGFFSGNSTELDHDHTFVKNHRSGKGMEGIECGFKVFKEGGI